MSREKKALQVKNAILKFVRQGGELSANEIRIILALERIVARMNVDPKLGQHLVYKGGFVLMKTLGSLRFTRDLDALGVDLDKKQVEQLVPAALAIDLDDGFWFGDIQVEDIEAQGEYGAFRFNCAYQIGDPPAQKKTSKNFREFILMWVLTMRLQSI
jgi:hypothetical protein